MAFENDVMDVSLLTATDLSLYQYHFVKMSADNTVVICAHATNDNPIGILQNKPVGTSAAPVVARVRLMGVSRAIVGAGGAVAFGELVGTDAIGEALTKTANKTKYLGVVLEGGSAAETASVLLMGTLKTISA
jgi:hypothetical protein